MNTQEAVQTLKSQFASQDWFSDVEPDQFNNIVVYVKYLSSEVIKAIPDKMEGHPVLAHFAVSKVDSKKFITDASIWQPTKTKGEWVVETVQKLGLNDLDEPIVGRPVKLDLEHLSKELDRLAEICGDGILQEIVFEIRDGNRALTNFSSKYPKVRNEMETLYATYGFDAINEEWE